VIPSSYLGKSLSLFSANQLASSIFSGWAFADSDLANAAVLSQTANETRLRNGTLEYIIYAPKESVEIFIGDRTGDFREFMRQMPSTVHKGRIFEVTVNHGIAPRHAICRYRIIPEAGK